jgi:hypothetical protein
MTLPATIEEYCAAARISRGTWYKLDPKPKHYKAGQQVRITETPEQYATRKVEEARATKAVAA